MLCLQSDALLREYLSQQAQAKRGESPVQFPNNKSGSPQENYNICSYMKTLNLHPKDGIRGLINKKFSAENNCDYPFFDMEEGGDFNCPSCNKQFLSADELDRHVLIHSQEGPYPCDFCEAVEKDKASLRSHWREEHSDETRSMCLTCGESFASRDLLVYHNLIHDRSKPHKCDVCGKAYVYRSDLRKHMVSHTGERPYMCNTCCKTFTRHTNLKKHQREHEGAAPFPCMDCDRLFASHDDLNRHSSTHTGDKPYSCSICFISFNRRDKLVRHEKIHVCDRPHLCPECPTSFTRKEELTKHMQFYHYIPNMAGHHGGKLSEDGITEDVVISVDPMHWTEQESSDNIKNDSFGRLRRNKEKHIAVVPVDQNDGRIFKCEYCIKRFRTKREMVRHTSVHTGYRPHICPVCDKAFARTDKLKRHLLTHNKKKTTPNKSATPVKHQCSICSKLLSSKNELRRHEMLHSALRPFRCSYCESSYCRRDKLVKHMKRNHLSSLHVTTSGYLPYV